MVTAARIELSSKCRKGTSRASGPANLPFCMASCRTSRSAPRNSRVSQSLHTRGRRHQTFCLHTLRPFQTLPAAIAYHPYDFFVRNDEVAPQMPEVPEMTEMAEMAENIEGEACPVDDRDVATAGGCWGSPSEVRRRLWEEDPSLNQELISSGTTISQLFSQDKWVIHRQPNRYFIHLSTLATSTVFRRVLPACMGLMALSVLLGTYNTLVVAVAKGQIGGGVGGWGGGGPLGIPPVPHTLLGAAVSLQLVFRTNGSYSRFQEGRALWGAVIHASRDWARMAAMYMSYEQSCKAAAYVQAYAFCLKSHLRRPPKDSAKQRVAPVPAGDDADMVVRQLLPPAEAEEVLSQRHSCYYLLCKMTELMHSSSYRLPKFVAMRMDDAISRIIGAMGGCERILGTPIPLSFTRHTSRCLSLWLGTLPLALWPVMQWACLPAMFFMGFIFIGIDEIGMEIEEPFCILPLGPLCKNIVRDVCAAMEMAKRPMTA